MPVISVRVPDEDLAFLKERGENVSEFVRAAIHHEIHWRRTQEARHRLRQVRFRPSKPVEEIIREDRDHGH